jgi:hypothetical protein
VILDVRDAADPQRDPLGAAALADDVDEPAQRYGLAVGVDVDAGRGHLAVLDEGGDDGRLGVGVGPTVDAEWTDVQQLVDTVHAGHSARRADRLQSLHGGCDGAAQDDVAAERLDGDLVGADEIVAGERVHDGALEGSIGHECSFQVAAVAGC